MESILSSIQRYQKSFILFLVLGLLATACATPPPPAPEPLPKQKKVEQSIADLVLWNGQKPSAKPQKGSPVAHLKACSSNGECGSGMSCTTVLGPRACFFSCNPKNGTGDVQNKDCILPENCVDLRTGTGVCIALPGQLYGIGSYAGIIRHKQGEKCLVKLGGCDSGLICLQSADTSKDGSLGACTESCEAGLRCRATGDCPKGLICTKGMCAGKDAKVKNNCKTPGTTCKSLTSGFSACLK